VPEALNDIVSRCLEKESSSRFSGAQGVLEALRDVSLYSQD